jgi:hypothetical protein
MGGTNWGHADKDDIVHHPVAVKISNRKSEIDESGGQKQLVFSRGRSAPDRSQTQIQEWDRNQEEPI